MAKAFFVNIFNTNSANTIKSVNFATPHIQTISGVVEDYLGNPAARDIRLYRKEEYIIDSAGAKTPYAVTTSNPTTGEYSFTVNANENTEWVVVCVGQGENETILVHNHIRVD